MGQLTENVWAGQALGREILGTEQTVSGVGSKTLRQYADQFYTGKRIFISVSGKVDEQRFMRRPVRIPRAGRCACGAPADAVQEIDNPDPKGH